MSKINIKTSTKDYDIYLEDNALDRLGELVDSKCVVVVDTKVYTLWKKYIDETLRRSNINYHLVTIDGGEENKNITNVLHMYEYFHDFGITKSDYIVCIGGGVLGDMTAFAGATYLRGVEVIQVPTTLLSMVDSSIGGKSAIDMSFGKNLVGVIKAPYAVLIDERFLSTLDKRQRATGMAEILKSGLISDTNILDEAEKNKYSVGRLIEMSLCVKGDIVMRDEFETHERMVLNFGHTIGHALEALGKYTRYTHGEAVAIGMYYALKLSALLYDFDTKNIDRVVKLLEKFDLPYANDYSVDEILSYITTDKKMRGNNINFVLLKDVGVPIIESIAIGDLKKYLEKIM